MRNLFIKIVNLKRLISIFNGGTFKSKNQSLISQLKLSLLTMTGYERGIKLINPIPAEVLENQDMLGGGSI